MIIDNYTLVVMARARLTESFNARLTPPSNIGAKFRVFRGLADIWNNKNFYYDLTVGNTHAQ